ncbi:MAG: hypothetical protein MUE50_05440 [Pirellulaceae bacterium]|nr:hypothetical protein [Pirellulaceae bacterium]
MPTPRDRSSQLPKGEPTFPQCLMEAGLATTVGPVAPRAELPEPDATFGPYRIGEELGTGGMGAVSLAEHIETGRRLALKVLNHRLESPQHRQRFLREGRLAASITACPSPPPRERKPT